MVHPNFSYQPASLLKTMQAGVVLQLYGGCMEVAMTNYAPIVFITPSTCPIYHLKKERRNGCNGRGGEKNEVIAHPTTQGHLEYLRNCATSF